MKIIQSNSNSPTYNLALEEYLFSEFQDDFLMFYVNDKSVILGSNQSVRNEVNQEFCKANDIQIIRRKSGGGTVFHDSGNLNFSFIQNKCTDKNSLSGDFLLPVVAWLSELGVLVTLGERKDLWLPNGYKITGTASHIRKNRELHHGTLLVDTNLELLQQSLLVKSIDTMVKATLSVRSKTKNILDYLFENKSSDLSAEKFINKLISVAEKYYNSIKLNETDFDQSEIHKLETNYKSDAWNFRK
jgi:lipoate---protein ligase